jgi:hypothetical protein
MHLQLRLSILGETEEDGSGLVWISERVISLGVNRPVYASDWEKIIS